MLKRLCFVIITIGLVITSSAQADFIGWGDDDSGQLSDIPGNENFVAFANLYATSLGLRNDGSIVAWGYDSYNVVSDAPTGTGYIDVAASYYTGFAIDSSGQIVGWGDDSYNEISDIPAGTGHTTVVGGYYAGFALTADGSIVGWGYEDSCQLGCIPAGTGHTDLATWYAQGYALTSDGSIVAWGYDSDGQVSNAPAGSGFLDIAATSYNGIALAADGSIIAWGDDSEGLVSDVPPGNDFVMVAGGEYTGFALRTDGSIVAWGYDEYGEVSDAPSGTGHAAVYGAYYAGFASVTDVVPTYSVGGNLSGLTGTGLALQNNGGDTLPVAAAATAFTFATELEVGFSYVVTVSTEPTGQTCTVSNGSGTISDADVTDVAVTCTDNPEPLYTINGTASGLGPNSVTLQNNLTDDLMVSANGGFVFDTALPDGSPYDVTVLTQPTGQTCDVTNGFGTISSTDVLGVDVDCVDDVVSPPTPTAPIPTLSEWALILLTMLLGLMVFANRRRLF
jgi:hypothetical protein